jgi:hypothetical protein
MRTSPKHPDFPTETEVILKQQGSRRAIQYLANLVEGLPLDLAELSLALAASG